MGCIRSHAVSAVLRERAVWGSQLLIGGLQATTLIGSGLHR